MPRALGSGLVLAEDVQIAVTGSDFEVGVVRAMPAVEHFFDHVIAAIELKADGAFIGFAARIAFDVDLHL